MCDDLLSIEPLTTYFHEIIIRNANISIQENAFKIALLFQSDCVMG